MNTIFVSSTFQDMQQERDVLQNSVLPRIKELAKQYGKSIDLCDLRWGVNTLGMSEAESAAKVLQVCFDEIDKASVNNGDLVPSARSNCTTLPEQAYHSAG